MATDLFPLTPLDPSFNLRRRPLSIFSRRGTDTPVSASPTRSKSVSMFFTPSAPTTTATQPKSKPWKLGKPATQRKRSSGTILRAVPEAGGPSARNMTQLELEMATSPNEEILSAIGQSGSPGGAAAFPLPEAVSFTPGVVPSSPTWFKRSKKTPEFKANFIGVWRDGKVQWESDACILPVAATSTVDLSAARANASIMPPRPMTSDPKTSKALRVLGIEEDMAKSHTPPPSRTNTTNDHQNGSNAQRPRIRVMVPQERLQRAFSYMPFGMQSANTAQDVSPLTGSATDTTVLTSVISPIVTYMPQPQRPFELVGGPISPELQEIEGWRRAPVPFSNSSSSSHTDDEDQSNYSNRSSMTSIDALAEGTGYLVSGGSPKRTASKAFSITSPVVAGVFDENNAVGAGPHQPTLSMDTNLRQPLVAGLGAIPAYANIAAVPSDVHISHRNEAQGTPSNPSTAASALQRHRKNLARLQTQNHSVAGTDYSKPLPPSPTLSEATKDLEAHLTAITEDAPWQWEDSAVPLQRRKSVRPPLIPARDRRRRSLGVSETSTAPTRQVEGASAPRARREMESAPTETIHSDGTPLQRWTNRKSWLILEEMTEHAPEDGEQSVQTQRNISAEAAEAVVLRIMESLSSLDDLFATALLNKGFYRVFKRHELRLMKTALKKSSPAAWEFRERSPPHEGQTDADPDTNSPPPEYTPATYLRHHTRDQYIIDALKLLILSRCQSFLRSETAAALSASAPSAQSQRFDDAFWRIWTFCKIFGHGVRGREEDIVAQMDWLRGGLLAHQQACTSSILSSDSFYVSNVLLSAPEHFARGNPAGLSAEQLYDMTEIWTCLGVLIQGVEGRTEQAREFGVFDNTEVRGGDIDGEEAMLEEWHHYLLTLGLSPILTLSHPSTLPDASVFILSQSHGWLHWTPPAAPASRATFLKEALSRVYEEKIAAAFTDMPEREQAQALRRQRAESMVAEIRARKSSGEGRRLVTMREERPMSGWSGMILGDGVPATVTVTASPVTEFQQRQEERRSSDVGAGAVSARSRSSTLGSSLSEGAVSRADTLVSPPSPVMGPKRVSVSSTSTASSRSSAAAQPRHPATQSCLSLSLPAIAITPSDAVSTPPTTSSSATPTPPSSYPSSQRSSSYSYDRVSEDSTTHRPPPPAATQHPLQLALLTPDDPTTSVDRAVYRIVEMGFTAEQARHALKVTDLGGGLDVGRAVELLLRA